MAWLWLGIYILGFLIASGTTWELMDDPLACDSGFERGTGAVCAGAIWPILLGAFAIMGFLYCLVHLGAWLVRPLVQRFR